LLRLRSLCCLLVFPVLALAACGDKSTPVNTASYTCGQFNKSLRTKGDNTSGAYINTLQKHSGLGQDKKVERREITLGIYFACRGKPASTRPAKAAVATAAQIKAGKFKLPGAAKAKKKSSK
jgi:hypothetical protein